MSTQQRFEEEYSVDNGTPVEALGRALEQLFDDRPPVYDVVDPDALNDLFAPRPDGTPRVEGTISFAYRDYEFVVDSDGEVLVEDA
ncbi:HalOD1 output domain-containing protein [Halomarina salina]|uniref:HalOD1 output domain-containing protein n=1 Tax=Halomarina salina TaxID=1872699 RepID=A0ABD5RRG1_9EURY|nr:HalOD1 output domain-containing protein [Halomarina salina]